MLLWLFDNCKRVFIGLKLKDGISGLIAFGEWKCIDEIKSCAASCLWFLGDILWLTSLISCSDVKSDIYITVKNQFDEKYNESNSKLLSYFHHFYHLKKVLLE